jgi:hypothetical protein
MTALITSLRETGGGWRLRFLAVSLSWLAVASLETAIAVVERWPAQFGGSSDPAKISTQWMSKGTALSPPLFLLIAMLVAIVLAAAARRVMVARLAAAIGLLTGLIGVVGSFGELLARATPAVPAGARDAAVVGIVFSIAVVGVALAYLRSPRLVEHA